MTVQETPTPLTAASHQKRAQYLRTMARTASTADVALTLVRLALHYERLAKESAARRPATDNEVAS